jgi:large subunit ribosomal protein L17e
LAIHFLEEACELKDDIQLDVEMQPTVDHLGEVGHALLLKFMSTPTSATSMMLAILTGRLIYNSTFVVSPLTTGSGLTRCCQECNIYVVQVETFLAKVFSASNHGDYDDDLLYA